MDDNGLTRLELEFLMDWFFDPGDERRGPPTGRASCSSMPRRRSMRTTSRSGTSLVTPRRSSQLCERFGELCDAAAERTDAKVVYEFMPFDTNVKSVDAVLEVVGGAARPNGGIAIDTWHMSKLGIAPDDLRRIPLEYMSWIELSDGQFADMEDPIDEVINHRNLPGEGEFDVRGYIKVCQDHGYAGPWGVETLSEELRNNTIDVIFRRAYEATAAQFCRRCGICRAAPGSRQTPEAAARGRAREELEWRTGKELDNDGLVWIYHQMLRIREFEERVKRTFLDHPGVIRGHTHLADGAEASIVGSIATLGPDDQFFTTYRCHGAPIARGSDVKAMMAEIYGRKDGLCKGLGGSMHLTDVANGFLGTSGIVGAGIPHAAGAAWAAQIAKRNQVVLCFFGDGASKQGAFAETLNIASLWKLPIVFIMENNGYNVHTRTEQEDANRASGEDLSVKAKAYSMPGVTIDGRDPVEVYETVRAAVARARGGDGPTLVESQMYRLSAHGNIIAPPGVPLHFPEHEAVEKFGNPEEYEAAKQGDPVPAFRGRLVADGTLTAEAADELIAAVQEEMQAAVTFGLESPFPDVESALEYTYA